MSGLNRVMLIGNLGRDPEIRYSNQGTAVCNFSIATSDKWKDKNTGQDQEKTEWHNCVSFGKQAEILEKYLSKGSKVYVEGSLTTDTYEKEGQTHYSTKIKVFNFQFLDSKQHSYGGQRQTGYQNQSQPNQQQYQRQNQPIQNNNQYQQQQNNQPIPDGDIPF